jgi:hypothetical protein
MTEIRFMKSSPRLAIGYWILELESVSSLVARSFNFMHNLIINFSNFLFFFYAVKANFL